MPDPTPDLTATLERVNELAEWMDDGDETFIMRMSERMRAAADLRALCAEVRALRADKAADLAAFESAVRADATADERKRIEAQERDVVREAHAAGEAFGRRVERARCLAVVEKAQRYEGETRFGLSGHTMERNEWGDWLDRDSTLAALRGTEEAPDDPH